MSQEQREEARAHLMSMYDEGYEHLKELGAPAQLIVWQMMRMTDENVAIRALDNASGVLNE